MWRALFQLCRDVLLWGFVAGLLAFFAVWLWFSMM